MTFVEPEIQEAIIKSYFEGNGSQNSLADQFGLSRPVVRRIVTNYRKEYQKSQKEAENLRVIEENYRLKKENAELLREVEFLKKAVELFTTGKS